MMQLPDTKITQAPPTIIRQLRASDLKYVLTDLTDVFVHTVNNGSPLGFLTPISRETARDYWISLIPELQPGGRILLIAADEEGRIIGSGQLALSQRQNSPHRAELQKLFVVRSARGQGVGAALVLALHRVARQHGRTLITLSTRQGEPPEAFYKSLGYKEAGVVPGWTIGPDGRSYDHVTLYHELGA
jgi:GNAT superfamily N-acetyltransferase